MKNVNSDIAYDYVRKRILNGKYPPGHALMTKMLSVEIGVSRTPVRDALRQLEVDGLVSIRPRIGASVKTMDRKEFSEMCVLRLALESHAAGLAALHRTEADLQEINHALDAMRQIESVDLQAQVGELVREDVRFHIAIMTAAKNDLMKKEIFRLHLINRVVSGSAPPQSGEMTAVERADRAAHRGAVLASHEEIYQAIAQRDVIAAKNSMERHIQDIIDRNLRALTYAEKITKELTEEKLSYSR